MSPRSECPLCTQCRLFADAGNWVQSVLFQPLSCLPVQGVSATNRFLPQSDRNQSTGSAPGQSRRHDFKTTVDHALIRGLVTAGPDASRSCLCLENQRRIETRLLVVTRVLLP